MSELLSKRIKSRPIIDLAAPVEDEVCGYHLMPPELDELALLETEIGELKIEANRLYGIGQEYDEENAALKQAIELALPSVLWMADATDADPEDHDRLAQIRALIRRSKTTFNSRSRR